MISAKIKTDFTLDDLAQHASVQEDEEALDSVLQDKSSQKSLLIFGGLSFAAAIGLLLWFLPDASTNRTSVKSSAKIKSANKDSLKNLKSVSSKVKPKAVLRGSKRKATIAATALIALLICSVFAFSKLDSLVSPTIVDEKPEKEPWSEPGPEPNISWNAVYLVLVSLITGLVFLLIRHLVNRKAERASRGIRDPMSTINDFFKSSIISKINGEEKVFSIITGMTLSEANAYNDLKGKIIAFNDKNFHENSKITDIDHVSYFNRSDLDSDLLAEFEKKIQLSKRWLMIFSRWIENRELFRMYPYYRNGSFPFKRNLHTVFLKLPFFIVNHADNYKTNLSDVVKNPSEIMLSMGHDFTEQQTANLEEFTAEYFKRFDEWIEVCKKDTKEADAALSSLNFEEMFAAIPKPNFKTVPEMDFNIDGKKVNLKFAHFNMDLYIGNSSINISLANDYLKRGLVLVPIVNGKPDWEEFNKKKTKPAHFNSASFHFATVPLTDVPAKVKAYIWASALDLFNQMKSNLSLSVVSDVMSNPTDFNLYYRDFSFDLGTDDFYLANVRSWKLNDNALFYPTIDEKNMKLNFFEALNRFDLIFDHSNCNLESSMEQLNPFECMHFFRAHQREYEFIKNLSTNQDKRD